MKLLYRLYTEKKPNIEKLVYEYFENFTILSGTGYYKGTKEDSVIIEIIGSPEDDCSIESLRLLIQEKNNQECVLKTIVVAH